MILDFLLEYSPLEIGLIMGMLALMTFLLVEIFDIKQLIWHSSADDPQNETYKTPLMMMNISYGYEDEDGPVMWRTRFSDANGHFQSPINISSKESIVLELQVPLHWFFYSAMPDQVFLCNDGHTINLQLNFPQNKPALSGGPLVDSYELCEIKFRWGANDYEGSEHSVNLVRYAMELQAIHTKKIQNFPFEEYQQPQVNCILIMSYVFQITDQDNPYLHDIVIALRNVRQSGARVNLPPFPVNWLMPQFSSDFYLYHGSLTHPPCSEGVKWIIQPEPLAISSEQVRQFRRICDDCGHPIQTNCRPVQPANKRDIYYYCD